MREAETQLDDSTGIRKHLFGICNNRLMGRVAAVERERGSHVPALDGLRGVAVAAVLCYHGTVGGMRGGFLGVSTFFTLSGFLIGDLVHREIESTGRLDLRAFWSRRARRLLPAALPKKGKRRRHARRLAIAALPHERQGAAFRLDGEQRDRRRPAVARRADHDHRPRRWDRSRLEPAQ